MSKDLDKQVIALLLFIIVLVGFVSFMAGYYWSKADPAETSRETIRAFFYGQVTQKLNEYEKEAVLDFVKDNKICEGLNNN